jgi:hypothetical protein
LILSPNKPFDSINNIFNASIDYFAMNPNLFYNFQNQYFVSPINTVSKGLIIPQYYFSPTITLTNIFNMKQNDFLSYKTCSAPIGSLFTIFGSKNIYNQFNSFTKTIEDYYPGCSVSQDYSIANTQMALDCNNIGTMSILLEIDSTAIKIIKLYGIPIIVVFKINLI